jgi:hypothetical protein
MSLQSELDELDRFGDPHERGLQFESFVARMLEAEGFDVTRDPRIATPRQTDLCARRDELFFIIETKWQRDALHPGEISDVRDRLRRTLSDVFACVFSMSGYAETTIKDLVQYKNPEVLLFNESEVRGITANEISFSELLRQKRDEIRRNSTVWFWDRPQRPLAMPSSLGPETYRIENDSRNWVLSKTQGDDVIFAREILDLGGHSGSAVSLRLSVRVRTTEDLMNVLRVTKHQLNLAGRDSFAIHQGSAGWYGTGLEKFVEATREWQRRYDDLHWPSYHHAEQLAYFDQLDGGGLLGFTAQQEVRPGGFLHSGFIEIITSGVPVDPSGMRRLCKKTDNQNVRFEVFRQMPIQTHRFDKPIEIEPVGVVVDPSKLGWATGVIAKNPFFKSGQRSSFDSPALGSSSAIRHLSNTEFLICRLKSWHPVGKLMDSYRVFYVEGCWIEHIPVLYVACDW